MGTLWTPSGERPIRREPDRGPGGGAAPEDPRPPIGGSGDRKAAGQPAGEDLGAEEESRLAALQEQLAHTPAELVIANHAFGLFELAALHLSLQPPQLPQAQLAIDALGALVEGLAGRLGEYETQLRDGLANLRLAYVQLSASSQPGTGGRPGAP